MVTQQPPFERPLDRRQLLKAGLGVALGGTLLAACGGSDSEGTSVPAETGGATSAATGEGKVIIGAFQDGALTPFKDAIVPLFEQETGITVEFLEDEYGTFFEKAFNDGQSQAGQYDVYILDDPWIPQFASAGILEDLTDIGIETLPDMVEPFIETGYWPPRSGPRVRGFEDQDPRLVAVPFIGDLQTMTYRNDVFPTAPATWDELVTTAQAAMDSGAIKYGFVFRGVAGGPIVNSWFPLLYSFGSKYFDDEWNVTFNDDKGKAATEFFVSTLKSLAPPGVVEFDSDQEGAAILGGEAAAIIQYSGNAIKSDDPAQSKVVGKLDFGVVPKQELAVAQLGIFISGIPVAAPNKDNALTFQRWFVQNSTQVALARAGALPVTKTAFADAEAVGKHRLLPVALEQANAGLVARARTPDYTKVEEFLGIALNEALQAGTTGDRLDVAAEQATEYLTQQGYYS